MFPEEISAVAASLDGRRLVAASRDRTVRVLDLEAGQLRERFRIEDIAANSVDLSQDGKLVAAGSADGAVRLWDDTGRLLNPAIKAHSDKVTTVRINPRGDLIASGSMDKRSDSGTAEATRWEHRCYRPAVQCSRSLSVPMATCSPAVAEGATSTCG